MSRSGIPIFFRFGLICLPGLPQPQILNLGHSESNKRPSSKYVCWRRGRKEHRALEAPAARSIVLPTAKMPRGRTQWPRAFRDQPDRHSSEAAHNEDDSLPENPNLFLCSVSISEHNFTAARSMLSKQIKKSEWPPNYLGNWWRMSSLLNTFKLIPCKAIQL